MKSADLRSGIGNVLVQHPQYDRGAQSNPWMGSLFGAPKDSLSASWLARPVSLFFFIFRFLLEREAKTKILIKIKLKVKEKISVVCGNALRGCSVLFFVFFAVYFAFGVMSVCARWTFWWSRGGTRISPGEETEIDFWLEVSSQSTGTLSVVCVCVCDGDNRERVPRGGMPCEGERARNDSTNFLIGRAEIF